MKKIILLIIIHATMAANANVFIPAENESGEIVKFFQNGELKIKGDESGQYYYAFPHEVLNHVKSSKGFKRDLPIKYIFSSKYYYGHVTGVFEADDKTIIKVYFETDDSINT